ncbi:MAG TPA: hypothetical protein VER58_08720 [Thermoanaerobaculia bacterium]|nr:hypothetical protein [Thermoanaerobaculia bacterium]
MTRSAVRALILALLLTSVVIPALPRLSDWLRLAWKVRAMPMQARREAVIGDLYRGVEQLRLQTPPGERLALIRLATADSLFVNYYLYPQRTRTYWNRWAYVHSDPKKRPRRIVQIDGGVPRLVTYPQLRDAELRRTRVVQIAELPAQTRTAFAIPIVTSIDGPPADSYTIEGGLASEDVAHVTLILQPGQIVKKLTINRRVTFYDLVYQCFDTIEFAAWVQVTSDRPIHAAFWLVNRRAKTAAPLRLIDGPIAKPAPFPVDLKSTLWLLNLGDDFTVAHSGSHDALVPPRTLLGVNPTGVVTGRVYAFVSTKLPNGDTRFVWAEDVK